MFALGFFSRLWLYERFGWFAIVLHLLFWILVVGLIVSLIRHNRRRRVREFIQHRQGANDPLTIAKQRYAKGEITKEQFDQINKDLK
jgi:putative membrane protein